MSIYETYTNGIVRLRADDTTRTVTTWSNAGVQTSQRAYTAAENADADARALADTAATNRSSIETRALAALTANATDVTQDATIITQANALAATTGTRTLAQLSGDVRALAQGVAILAGNDTNAKRELNALIRLALGQFDATT